MKANNQGRIQELCSMPYEEYLKTPEWREKREQALERDGHCCRVCNSGKNLDVHHRTYVRRGNESPNDLTTLCRSCHEYFHKRISQTEIMERTYQAPQKPVSKEERTQKWEDYLIGLLIQNPNLYPHARGILSKSDFLGQDTAALFQLLDHATTADVPFEQLVSPDLSSAVSRAVNVSKADPLPGNDDRAASTIEHLCTQIRYANLLRLSNDSCVRMQEASAAGDKAAEQQFRERLFEYNRLIQTINKARRLSHD
jgi:hypothetical protein